VSADVGSPGLGDEVRLARLHLRVGMLTLAAAELEDLERRSLLDLAGRAALAEARWRSGEADGAAAAARAHLEAGGDDPVALCIAAEAAAADGKPGEARSIMERLGPPDPATLDALFAGMPRRAFWPSTEGDPFESETLFGEIGRAAPGGDRGGDRGGARGPRAVDATGPRSGGTGERTPAHPRAVPGPREVFEATEPGLWGAPVAGGEAARGERPATGDAPGPGGATLTLMTDPVAELALAREELDAEPDRALLRLALILRTDPTLAPAVLDAVSLRHEPMAALLRGDAQRLLGRHLEAEAAFAGAARGLEPLPTGKPS
jgi:hypothetical protein